MVGSGSLHTCPAQLRTARAVGARRRSAVICRAQAPQHPTQQPKPAAALRQAANSVAALAAGLVLTAGAAHADGTGVLSGDALTALGAGGAIAALGAALVATDPQKR